jgi:hypothetical protein
MSVSNASAVPASSAIGAPSVAAAEGTTYYEQDAAGQIVAEWLRSGGTWVKIIGPPPVLMLAQSGTSSPASATGEDITWTSPATEDDATQPMFASGTPTQFTIQRAGIYEFFARIKWTAFVSGTGRQLLVYSGVRTLAHDTKPGVSSMATVNTCSGLERMAVGEVVKVQAYQDSGSARQYANGVVRARWVRA